MKKHNACKVVCLLLVAVLLSILFACASASEANDIGTADASNASEYEELAKGAKGEAVVRLQERLAELGFYTKSVDGDYGKGTVAAVEEFQRANDLPVTGVASSESQAVLYSDEAKGKQEPAERNDESGAAEYSNSQAGKLTLDGLYENVKTSLSSMDAKLSDILYSEGYHLFSVTTEKYGQSLFAVTVDDDRIVKQIIIDPLAGAQGESQDTWSVFDELTKYITAVDTTLDGYDAYAILADSEELHEKNGFVYYFDIHDTGYFSIIQK